MLNKARFAFLKGNELCAAFSGNQTVRWADGLGVGGLTGWIWPVLFAFATPRRIRRCEKFRSAVVCPMVFKYKILNVLLDDVVNAMHFRERRKITLYHCLWGWMVLMGLVFGCIIGSGRLGAPWGIILGGALGLPCGYVLGWMLYCLCALAVKSLFRLMIRKRWCLHPGAEKQDSPDKLSKNQ